MTGSLLVEAAQRGDVAAVKARLECGDDINKKVGTDNALLWAAYNGHTEVVSLLIERGADLSVTNGGGTSPLKLAEKHPQTAAVLAAAVERSRQPPPKSETWVAMGETSVAHVGVYPGIERKLTQVFNFETRQHLILSENLRSKAETAATPTSFDDLPLQALAKALEEFERLGGKTDPNYVLQGASSLEKPRKSLTGVQSHD